MNSATIKSAALKSCVVAVVILCGISAIAKEWLVSDGDLVALTNAVTQAVEDDVITLAEGTYAFKDSGMAMKIDGSDDTLYVTNWLYINKQGVELRGDPSVPRESVVIDANGAHCRAVYVGKSNVRLSNITFRNGFGGEGCSDLGSNAGLRGGAVNFNQSGIVTNCCFIACESAGYGALYGGTGTFTPTAEATWGRPYPTVIDCRFESCSGVAAFGGDHYGCVFYENEQSALVRGSASNCWFEANAGTSGSAVTLSKTTQTNGKIEPQEFIDCTFIDNVSTGSAAGSTTQHGGAVVIDAGPMSQTNVGTNLFLRCHFRGNTSNGSGGAVLQCSTTGSLSPVSRFVDCDFEGNSASCYGGAVCDFGFYNGVERRGLLVEGGVLSGNVNDGTPLAQGTIMDQELSKVCGGGAVAGAEVHGATITNNLSRYLGGGGFYGRYYGCTFSDNRYTEEVYGAGGGAAYELEYATNCTFTLHGQKTKNGNGAILLNPVVVIGCTFKDNVGVFDHDNPCRSLVEARRHGMSFSDCMFTNCPGDRSYATILNSSTERSDIVWCRFIDCCCRTELCATAAKASFWSVENCDAADCEFDGGMNVTTTTGGSAVRCVFENIDLTSATSKSLFRNNGDYRFALTNCLVTGCKIAPSAYMLQRAKDVVNCTFVDNDLSLCSAGIAYTNNLVNCIFYGSVGKSDLQHRVKSDTYVTVSHCLFQTNTQGFDGSFVDCGGNVVLAVNETPRFNGMENPKYPYFMPRRSSRAVDAGAMVAGLVGETDLFGSRYGNGAVDIGCYECVIRPPSFVIVVR